MQSMFVDRISKLEDKSTFEGTKSQAGPYTDLMNSGQFNTQAQSMPTSNNYRVINDQPVYPQNAYQFTLSNPPLSAFEPPPMQQNQLIIKKKEQSSKQELDHIINTVQGLKDQIE